MRLTANSYKRICAGLLCAVALLFAGCRAPEAAPPETEAEVPADSDAVEIAELMLKNQATLDDGSGLFPDWVEVHNTGEEALRLANWMLSDREDRPRWRFPDVTIEPDGYLVVFCAKGKAPEGSLRAGFGISAEEGVWLFAPDGSCKAAALEEEACISKPATFSFMLNENLHLPLLSIATDDPAAFRTLYFSSARDHPMKACAEYFNGEHSFRKDCILELKGWTSLSLPKKSLGLGFDEDVDGLLHADVFGNGITEFSDLSVRAGQDNLKTLFRTELVQDLADRLRDRAFARPLSSV